MSDPVLAQPMTVTMSDGLPGAYGVPYLGVPMVGGLFDLSFLGAGCASGINWALPTTPLLGAFVPPSGELVQVIPVPDDPALICASFMVQTVYALPTLDIELSNSWLATAGY